MGFEPTTLRDLVGCSNHWATGDSVVSKSPVVGMTGTASCGYTPIYLAHVNSLTASCCHIKASHCGSINCTSKNKCMRGNPKLCHFIQLHIPDDLFAWNYPSLFPKKTDWANHHVQHHMSTSNLHSKMRFPLFLPVYLISRWWKLSACHKLKTRIILLELTSTSQLPSFLRTVKLLLTEEETVKKNNH